MVIAEVPLWVIHDTGAAIATSNIIPATAVSSSSTSTTADNNLTISADDNHNNIYQNAVKSLETLLPSNNNNNKKKCAIYSIDIHPDCSRFVTAGGDNTVRIWNMNSLFQSNNHDINLNKNNNNNNNDLILAKYDDENNGAYISTEYSSSSNDDDSDDDDESHHHNGVHDVIAGSNGKYVNNNELRNNDDNDDSMQISSSHSLDGNHQHKPFSKLENEDVQEVRGNDNTNVNPMTTQLHNNNDHQPGKEKISSLVVDEINIKKNITESQTNGHKEQKNNHRLLCTLSAHTGSSVLIVRFSNNGKYLASGADDSSICIYTLKSKSNMIGNNIINNSSSQANNVEHWTRIRLLRGHSLDVVDIAWSPNDEYLVSCSLDSDTPIIVWDLNDLNTTTTNNNNNIILKPYKILNTIHGHTSTVKGVAYDPAGTYIASSSDDPAVCIWRTDDWELENKIDSSSGIFRMWNNNTNDQQKKNGDTDNNVGIIDQSSLFRRICWSTDGSYVCSTNSVMKNKHVLSTITRDGWKTGDDAVNLIGHKQPIVVCRHSNQLLSYNQNQNQKSSPTKTKSNNQKEMDNNSNDNNNDPNYATLLAMGDKRGFVTIWSTKNTRPIFKIQCSENRATVTDLSWGYQCNNNNNESLVLLISLLDGQIVALKFHIPDEIGYLLTQKQKARVFQLRYGIDIDDYNIGNNNNGWLSSSTRMNKNHKNHKQHQLIENALQLSLEDEQNNHNSQVSNNKNSTTTASQGGTKNVIVDDKNKEQPKHPQQSIKAIQQVTVSKDGKKRIRPVLLTETIDDNNSNKQLKTQPSKEILEPEVPMDPIQRALDTANRVESKAVSLIESANIGTTNVTTTTIASGVIRTKTRAETIESPPRLHHPRHSYSMPSSHVIPHSTDRLYTADLPLLDDDDSMTIRIPTDGITTVTAKKGVMIVECKNGTKIPVGLRGNAIPCVDIMLIKNGNISWKDQIIAGTCSAISSSELFVAIGMVDGSIQLYSTSRSVGWICGNCFRSHPPFIPLNGHPIVSLQLINHNKKKKSKKETSGNTSKTEDSSDALDLLVVAADGSFGIYTVLPQLQLLYKGTVLSAMVHMSSSTSMEHHRLPKLSRIYITETGRLVLLLSSQRIVASRTGMSATSSITQGCVGGTLQAYVYEQLCESWMRISDSRFVLSDFYSTLPLSVKKLRTTNVNNNISSPSLSQLDDSIRHGSIQSLLLKKVASSNRNNTNYGIDDQQGNLIYSNIATSVDDDDYANFIATRSHCEDRMSCAIVLGSQDEFKYWLTLYVKALARSGHGIQLQLLSDMILGKNNVDTLNDVIDTSNDNDDERKRNNEQHCWWWLGNAPTILELSRKDLVQTILIPEMSKNRALQRITNEIAVDVGTVS